jgi:uncharacterized Ntn-hydrolase superfamily protein
MVLGNKGLEGGLVGSGRQNEELPAGTQPAGNGAHALTKLVAGEEVKHVGGVHRVEAAVLEVEFAGEAAGTEGEPGPLGERGVLFYFQQAAGIKVVGNDVGTGAEGRKGGDPRRRTDIEYGRTGFAEPDEPFGDEVGLEGDPPHAVARAHGLAGDVHIGLFNELRYLPMRPLLVVVVCGFLSAQVRPVHTFSIVARDPATGELGVAVQSHWFAVGSTVPWIEAGVGAVATQSFVDPSYGKLGLDLMRAGRPAPDALKGLVAADEGRDVRQVAMIDAQGRVAAYTGSKDIADAGHIAGNNFSVQANMMLNDKVWPAMARAFEQTKGDLTERMLAALDAAQAAGGDIRGKQSAALIVVAGRPTGKPWVDRTFDLRVDDSEAPLAELRRLATLQRAFNHMNQGDLAVELKDNERALREYSAAARLVPGNAEMVYWHAVALVSMGRVEESLPLFKKVFAQDGNWRTLTRRLPKAGLLPDDAGLIERITRD